MFTKQSLISSFIAKNVKFALAATMFTAAISVPSLASTYTHARLGEVVSVKFSVSETKTPEGLEKVYAMMETKASKACAGESKARFSAYNSVEECVSDLMDQLVKDADMDTLTRMHRAPKAKVVAQN